MFGTVIIDSYTQSDTESLALAIDDICCPCDHYGWASAGIYCFWNYDTHEVLYIGLASDLHIRFKQHNGLLSMKDGCKYNQIKEYFNFYNKLGYTIFVQSPLAQPLVNRNKPMYQKIANEINSNVNDMISTQGRDDIKCVEGILIEAYNQYYGKLPIWNKIGGCLAGQKSVSPNNINIVKSFANPQEYKINCIVSRSTIRELSFNPTYENFLHGIRQLVLMFGMDYKDAINFMGNFVSLDILEEMEEKGYFRKKLIV